MYFHTDIVLLENGWTVVSYFPRNNKKFVKKKFVMSEHTKKKLTNYIDSNIGNLCSHTLKFAIKHDNKHPINYELCRVSINKNVNEINLEYEEAS